VRNSTWRLNFARSDEEEELVESELVEVVESELVDGDLALRRCFLLDLSFREDFRSSGRPLLWRPGMSIMMRNSGLPQPDGPSRL